MAVVVELLSSASESPTDEELAQSLWKVFGPADQEDQEDDLVTNAQSAVALNTTARLSCSQVSILRRSTYLGGVQNWGGAQNRGEGVHRTGGAREGAQDRGGAHRTGGGGCVPLPPPHEKSPKT